MRGQVELYKKLRVDWKFTRYNKLNDGKVNASKAKGPQD